METTPYHTMDFQRDILNDWGAVGADGKFANSDAGASIPRQVGKSVAAVGYGGFCAEQLGMKVLYTAHNYQTTCEMLGRFKRVFGSRAHDPNAEYPAHNRQVMRYNGKTAQESFHMRSGGGVWFSTRTKTAGLGMSFDIIILDEAQELTNEHMTALTPTLSAGDAGNPQMIMVGTPRRPGSPADVFAKARGKILAGRGRDACWIEWGAEEIGDVADEARWYLVNPSLGQRASTKAIRLGLSKMSELSFAQEYLGYWLPQARQLDPAIDMAKWAELRCKVAPDGRIRRSHGVKFSPDGEVVCLSVATLRADGRANVELLFCEPKSRGTRWLAEWLLKRERVTSSNVIDGKGDAANLARELEGMPYGCVHVASTQMALEAADLLCSEVNDGTVTWSGLDGVLDESASTSPRLAVGSNGGWKFGGEKPTAITSAALALWGLRNIDRDPDREQEIGW